MTYEERTRAEVEALLNKATKKSKEEHEEIVLDPSQKSAIGKIKEWFTKNDSLIFVLSGRAGTGKSTIINKVIEELRLREDEVRYLAPTGKAVSVLRSKGIRKAMTIHSFIYRFDGSSYKNQKVLKEKSMILKMCDEGNYEEAVSVLDNIEESKRGKKKPKLYFSSRKVRGLNNLKLIVVDESSMINDDEVEDITNLGIKTIFVGDNAQLPPVEGVNSIMDEPDAEILKIHRQTEGSGIIKLANLIMDYPDMKFLEDTSFGHDVEAITRQELSYRLYELISSRQWQFLTVTNREKDSINNSSRHVLGYSDSKFPKVGELLLAKGGHKDTGIVNGIQGKVIEDFTESEIEHDSIRYWVIVGRIQLMDGTGAKVPVIMRRNNFLSGSLYEFEDGESLWEYGYAMTVHKSQGSQWPNVVYIFDDCLNHLNKLNYTAVTRASKRLIFVTKA